MSTMSWMAVVKDSIVKFWRVAGLLVVFLSICLLNRLFRLFVNVPFCLCVCPCVCLLPDWACLSACLPVCLSVLTHPVSQTVIFPYSQIQTRPCSFKAAKREDTQPYLSMVCLLYPPTYPHTHRLFSPPLYTKTWERLELWTLHFSNGNSHMTNEGISVWH